MNTTQIMRWVILTVILITAFFYVPFCQAELYVAFLDVGAADCILIESDGATMMVDTGYAKTWPHVLDVLPHRITSIPASKPR